MGHVHIAKWPIVVHVEYRIRQDHAIESNKRQLTDRPLQQNRIVRLSYATNENKSFNRWSSKISMTLLCASFLFYAVSCFILWLSWISVHVRLFRFRLIKSNLIQNMDSIDEPLT